MRLIYFFDIPVYRLPENKYIKSLQSYIDKHFNARSEIENEIKKNTQMNTKFLKQDMKIIFSNNTVERGVIMK